MEEDIEFDGKTYKVETYSSFKRNPALDNAVSLQIEQSSGEQRASIWEMTYSDEKHLLSLERDEDIPDLSDPDHQFTVTGSDFIALQHFLRKFTEYSDLDDKSHIVTTDDPNLSSIFSDLTDRFDSIDEDESKELLKVMVQAISRFSEEVDGIDVSEEITEEESIRAHSMLKIATVRKACDRLEEIIENGEGEDSCQTLLGNHPWILGNEYNAKLDRELLYEGEVDFALKSVDGFLDFIELKRPDMDVVAYDDSHENYYPRHDLNKAISQLSHYVREAERHESRISDDIDEVRPLKPRGVIIMGSDLDEDEREGLRIIESHLTRIDIITYTDLQNRARRIEQLYERDGELKTLKVSE